ncbi:nucleoside deaminase [Erysipelothrix sp. HDW6B]|uniref:nucleoside deaminase n=1 Tax=Erysipelothrix TaxID=1647 RepID=UPI00135A41D8|nr:MULTISPECIES: nucleoside deaminase [Erysipelothrix]QIK86588.1 nucleoside deaminase [Erysipelothrix sp. HDW6B]
MDKHKAFMMEALALAKQAMQCGDEPFGALLVKDGKCVATSMNRIKSVTDPTMHAELALISEFCRQNKITDLSEYTLYTSCEPCFMCSGAMVWSTLGTLVFSAGSRDLNFILDEPQVNSSETVFIHSHYQPEVIKHVLHEEGIAILASYFK